MTLDGIPETEREATVLALDGAGRSEPLDGCVSLAEAAERIGVPVNVLVRWCGDGTCPEGEGFRGRALLPGSLRFERDWLDDFLERREVNL